MVVWYKLVQILADKVIGIQERPEIDIIDLQSMFVFLTKPPEMVTTDQKINSSNVNNRSSTYK